MKSRVVSLDILKTIAILAVLFYHMTVLQNGYLGVEIFFVVSGYLFVKGNLRKFKEKTFNPINFVLKKLLQFWPLILGSCLVSLIIGYFVMLPDDYENLSQSVIASSIFANNILQAITTRNYWDVVNTFKPLMHLWYISVLMQAYVILGFSIYFINKISKKDYSRLTLISLTLLSILLYLLPVFNDAEKFYYIPFRLFEITFGGVIAFLPKPKLKVKSVQWIGNISLFYVVFIIFSGIIFNSAAMLISIVVTTGVTIWFHASISEDYGMNKKTYNVLSLPGKYSYYIYIWHQIVIAFLLYVYFESPDIVFILLVIALSFIFSFLSVVIDEKIFKYSKSRMRALVNTIIFIAISALSSMVLFNAGIVRDVPELGIIKNDNLKVNHAAYVDIPYSWDRDFSEKNNIKILVVGDSFARDFSNILNESAISDEIEISYIYDDNAAEEMDRVDDADYVFYGKYSWEVSNWMLSHVNNDKLYIIGNKSFGNSNGIIYNNRKTEKYFDQTVELSDEFIKNNYALKGKFQDHYIDMIAPLKVNENSIKVFTDNNYFISQDTRHLTKNGAKYYAEILDLSFIN